jgi:hypothetical protein
MKAAGAALATALPSDAQTATQLDPFRTRKVKHEDYLYRLVRSALETEFAHPAWPTLII